MPPHLAVSGASRAAERLSAELSEHVEVHIANMGGQATEPVLGGQARRVPLRTRNLLGWAGSLVPHGVRSVFYISDIPSKIRQGNYDLVHLHNPIPALELMRVARACLRRRVPYVISTHGFEEIARAREVNEFGTAQKLVWSAVVERPIRYVLRHADQILLLSEADRESVRKLGGGARPTTVVPNGVDLPQLSADPSMRSPDTERPLRLFFLANHTPNKGLEVLLEAFVTASATAELVVGGEERDRVNYEAYISRCTSSKKLVITGFMSGEEVDACFRSCDVFVFPTLADTFPLVVLESMSYAKAVIASRVGGIPHEVDNSCAVLVPPGSVDELRKAIEDLAANRLLLAQMGASGRARVAKMFTWPTAAAAALKAYRAVAKSS